MITEALLNFLFFVPNMLLNSMEGLTIAIPVGIYTPLLDAVTAIGSLMPVAQLLPILAIEFSVQSFRIVWALIIRIKSFIPTMGA